MSKNDSNKRKYDEISSPLSGSSSESSQNSPFSTPLPPLHTSAMAVDQSPFQANSGSLLFPHNQNSLTPPSVAGGQGSNSLGSFGGSSSGLFGSTTSTNTLFSAGGGQGSNNSHSANSTNHKLYILYQSLEGSGRFTNDLTNKLKNCISSKASSQASASSTQNSSYPLISCADIRTATNNLEYHTQVKNLLGTYISHLQIEPDIIVLGEYSPVQGSFLNVTAGNVTYKVTDNIIGTNKNNYPDLRRGMTILIKEGTKNVDRIRVHNKNNTCKDIWCNHSYMTRLFSYINNVSDTNIELTEFQNTQKAYEQGRDKMVMEKWQKAVGNIGECIEIMYRNRYIAMAHVPNKDPDPKKRASNALQNVPFAFIAGDMNFGLEGNQHDKTKRNYNKTANTMNANTDCSSLFGQLNSNYYELQSLCNISGSTCSSDESVAHDGFWNFSQAHTNLNIIGSLWPIVDAGLFQGGKYYVMGDHKGFLLEIDTKGESIKAETPLIGATANSGSNITPLSLATSASANSSNSKNSMNLD